MKLMDFSARATILGKEREVQFSRRRPEGADGEHGWLQIFGLGQDEASEIFAVLSVVTREQAKAALLKDQTSTLSGTAAAVTAAVAEKAPEAAATPAKERKKRTEVVQPAEPSPTTVPPGKLSVVGVNGQVLAHGGQAAAPAPAPAQVKAAAPAADDLEEDEDDELEELAGALPDWQAIPVDTGMKMATKATPVFRRLALELKMDVESMVAFCKLHQAEIPALAGDPSALDTRVRNAHRVLTAQATAQAPA
jgi:hypothetical protein